MSAADGEEDVIQAHGQAQLLDSSSQVENHGCVAQP